MVWAKLGMTDDVAFAIGTATPVEIEASRFGVGKIRGTIADVEALSEIDTTGVIEGCWFGAMAGEI